MGGMFLKSCLFLALLGPVAGSHFRYGTLSWYPTNTPESGGFKEVSVHFEAVFRRDYAWGNYFDEHWQQTVNRAPPAEDEWSSSGEVYGMPGYEVNTDGSNSNPKFDLNVEFTDDFDGNGIPGETFYMRFPPTLGFTGERLDMSVGEYPQQCPDPFFCDILKPGCTVDDYNWTRDDGQEAFNIPAPALETSPHCAVDNKWNPSRCGEWRRSDCQGSWRCGVYTANFNYDDLTSTDFETDGSCVSWASSFGMYLGDGTARIITLTSTDIDYSCLADTNAAACASNPDTLGCETCNSITGNYIRAQEDFTHSYQINTAEPWLLVFTGGNRIYECQYFSSDPDNTGLNSEGECALPDLDHLLNNNAEGRYRLEMEIWMIGEYNESPVVTQEAVLPIVRSKSFDHRTPFQIPAYDNDLDHMVFRFGTRNENGGITRSKMSQFPYSLNPISPGAKNNEYSQYADNECSANSRTFINNGTCASDRTPFPIWGTEEFSFTSDVPGLVEWRTFYPDYVDEAILVTEAKRKQPLPVGLYNMVVMVMDVALIYNEDGTVEENMEIMSDYAIPEHTVFDRRYNQTFIYKIKVPLDYLLYLYDGPVYFCNKGCKDNKKIELENSLRGEQNGPDDNSYPGAETYADRDGIYGYRFPSAAAQQPYTYPLSNFSDPWTGMDAVLERWGQECTICGYGAGTDDATLCTPFSDDGLCGTTLNDGSLVPTSFACYENQPPYFTRWDYNPLLPEYGNNGKQVSGGEFGPRTWEANNKANPWLDEEYICRSMTGGVDSCYCAKDSTNAETGLCELKDDFFREGIPTTAGGRYRANPGPYYPVQNNPGVESWYSSVEHVNQIVPIALDTPEGSQPVSRYPYEADALVVGEYVYPNITVYKGEPFEFYITAKDDDDCTELSLSVSSLPRARFQVVDGVDVEGVDATMSDPDFITDYPEFPQGMMVRKRFYWAAPALSAVDPVFDTRAERSYVCFYADDKYLYTLQPLYCIDLIIIFRPVEIEELEECFCRTCGPEGKYVGTRFERPNPNYAPRTAEYLSMPMSEPMEDR